MMMKFLLFLVMVASLPMEYMDGCRTVRISSNCPPGHASPITTYWRTNITLSGHPVYRSDTSDLYMYCIQCHNATKGRWVVSDTVGAVVGYIMFVEDNHFNADEITGTFYIREHVVWRELPDVKISCTEENIALGKPVSQSSTDGSNTAGLAVDGEKGTSVPANQCTLTNPEEDPWLEVDLGRDWPVSSVRVLNRGDCCGSRLHNFEVRVKREGQSWTSSEICGARYSETPTNGQSITVNCGHPVIGRYVRIQLPVTSDALSVCELEVFPGIGCPSGYIVHGGSCYKPYSTPKTRQDALATCQRDGGTLAMPRHRHIDSFMRKVAILVDIVSSYWIGLSKDNETWVWDDGNPLCGFQGFVAGYPSTTNNCTALRVEYAGGSWRDMPCETLAKFICQVQPTVDLGHQQYGGASLQAFPEEKTFDEAVAACDRLYGGRLAQPSTEDFNDRLKGIVGEVSADGSFWIGMERNEVLHSWLDGTPLSFVNWTRGEPSGEGCVMMTSDGSWRIGNCEEKAYFVCQIGDESLCEMEPPSKVYCGGATSGSSGQISSPGYGEILNIPNNLNCEWKITVPDGQVVQLRIEDFRLEETDYLEIFDICPYGYMNANLTGSNVSSPIITTTNTATLVFHTNGLKPGHGFNINFQAVPPQHFWPTKSQSQGGSRSKRSLPAVFTSLKLELKDIIDIGIAIINGVSKVFNGQEADRQHQELVDLMTTLKNDINDLSTMIDEQGIINELNHEEEIAATKYSASVETVKNYLDTLNTRLQVTINGTLRPEVLAQTWADSMLQQDSEGMNQALNNLYGMIMGSSTVFQGRPFMQTISAMLKRKNLSSSEYRTGLKIVFQYIMDLEAGGYAAWILALKQNAQVDQIDEVSRRGSAKLSVQNCFVAPLFYDWPAGSYGLPKTTGGCPIGWEEGQYEHKRDNSFNLQQIPPVHFNGTFSNNTVVQGYCMKTNPSGSDHSWSKGSYCILKHGRCPPGFGWGKLGFPGGTKTGVVPDGSSDGGSVEMEYCCRDDGFASIPIRLPPNPAFYLLRFEGECQQVDGMDVGEEWIEYKGNGYRAGVTPDDDGDDNSHKLYYCLYSAPGFTDNIPATPIVSAAVQHTANTLNLVTGVIISCVAVLCVLL